MYLYNINKITKSHKYRFCSTLETKNFFYIINNIDIIFINTIDIINIICYNFNVIGNNNNIIFIITK